MANRHSGYYVIITSLTELCRWLRKEDIEVTGIYPIKGISDEDIIRLEYLHKEEV